LSPGSGRENLAEEGRRGATADNDDPPEANVARCLEQADCPAHITGKLLGKLARQGERQLVFVPLTVSLHDLTKWLPMSTATSSG
jgi:hypothetical protein